MPEWHRKYKNKARLPKEAGLAAFYPVVVQPLRDSAQAAYLATFSSHSALLWPLARM